MVLKINKINCCGLVIAGVVLGLNVSCTQPLLQKTSTKFAGPGSEGDRIVKDVCVSLEGNGENFSSHFGAFTALMEKGFNPKVVAGGSSGAAVAGIIRLLMTNPSIAHGTPGDGLDAPRRAARVLAASKGVIESLLFLPALNDLKNAISSLAITAIATQKGLGFLSNPDFALAHAEAITSQLLIAGQYFGQTDFSKIIGEADFEKRVQLMRKDYIQTYSFIEVSPTEFVLAMLTPESQSKDQQEKVRFSEIRNRYFSLFQSNIQQDSKATAEEMLQKYENGLNLVGPLLNANFKAHAESIYMKALDSSRTLPFVGALAATVTKTFLMPDPGILKLALEGKDKNGKILQIPDGALIHTTARLGEFREPIAIENLVFKPRRHSITQNHKGKRIDDKPGFDTLYQVYFANDALTTELQSAQQKSEGGLLTFIDDEKKTATPLASSLHAQAFGGLNLQEAVTMSISEPGVFRRLPLEISRVKTVPAAFLAPDLRSSEAFLISYGGWLDTSASSTLAKTPSCAPGKISHFVYLHPNRLTNDFQKNALLDTINDRKLFKTKKAKEADTQRIDKAFADLGKYLEQSRAVDALEQSINFSWNWDAPIPGSGAKVESLNKSLKQNRPLFLYAAYTGFKAILEKGAESKENEFSQVFQKPIIDVNAALLRGEDENKLVESIFGRN